MRTETLSMAFFTLALAAPVQARVCSPIEARLAAAQMSAECRSPIGYCTAGTIEGNHGLVGTTRFSADSAALGPATAPHAAATNAYSGLLRITTADGSLTLRDSGLADNAAGNEAPGGFSSSYDVVTGGTGRYAGASGHFFIAGRTVGGKFTSVSVVGELCVP